MSKYYRVTHKCTTSTWEIIEASNVDEAEEKYGDEHYIDDGWYSDQGELFVEEVNKDGNPIGGE
jgi:hypothetical protein